MKPRLIFKAGFNAFQSCCKTWSWQTAASHLQCQRRWASVAEKVPPGGCRNGWCCQTLWSPFLSASLQEAWGTNVVSDRALLYVRVFTATVNVRISWKRFLAAATYRHCLVYLCKQTSSKQVWCLCAPTYFTYITNTSDLFHVEGLSV